MRGSLRARERKQEKGEKNKLVIYYFVHRFPISYTVKILNVTICCKLLGGHHWYVKKKILSFFLFLFLSPILFLVLPHDICRENEKLFSELEEAKYRKNFALDSNKANYVELNIDIALISFDTFDPLPTPPLSPLLPLQGLKPQPEWRMRLEVRNLFVDDHISTSKLAKMCSFPGVRKMNLKKVLWVILERGKYTYPFDQSSFKFKVCK